MPLQLFRKRGRSDASTRSTGSVLGGRLGRSAPVTVNVDVEPLPRMPAKFRRLIDPHRTRKAAATEQQPLSTTKPTTTKKERRISSFFAWKSTVDLRRTAANVPPMPDTDTDSLPPASRTRKISHDMPSLVHKPQSSSPDTAVVTLPEDPGALSGRESEVDSQDAAAAHQALTQHMLTAGSVSPPPPPPQQQQQQQPVPPPSDAEIGVAVSHYGSPVELSPERAVAVEASYPRLRSDTVSSKPALKVNTTLSRQRRSLDGSAQRTGSAQYATPADAMTPTAADAAFHTPSQHTPPVAAGRPDSLTPMASDFVERGARSMDEPRAMSSKPRRPSTSAIASTTSTNTNMSTSTTTTPRKLPTILLHSGPMPQPIAHLPSLQQSPGVWGSLAGPKSPALSRTSSCETPTASPFPQMTPLSRSNSHTNRELTDAEVVKATKSMPVMLRVKSNDEESDDGAEAEEILTESDESGPSRAEQSSSQWKGKQVASMGSLVEAESPMRSGSRTGTTSPVETPKPEIVGSSGSSALGHPSKQPAKPEEGLPSAARETNVFFPPAAIGQQQQVYNSPTPDAGPSSGDYFSGVRSASSSNALSSNATDDASPEAMVADDSDSVAESNETEGDSMFSLGEASTSTGTHTVIGTPSTPTAGLPPTMQPLAGPALTRPASALPPTSRPPLYSQASHSMINLSSSPSAKSTLRPPLATVAELTPPADAAPPKKRRLSAGDANPAPPKYEPIDYVHEGPVPKPREEEGRERLPGYWCGVHIEGTLSRKMEFTQPGVQAKDRGWRKHYFVLHGTALFVYKFDPGKVPLRANEPYITCTEEDCEDFLHVHPPPDRRQSTTAMPISTIAPRTSTPALVGVSKAEKQLRRNTISLEGLRGTSASLQQTFNPRRGTVGSSSAANRRASTLSPPPPPRPPVADGGRDAKNPELFTQRNPRRQSTNLSVSSSSSAPIAAHLPFAHNMLLHTYSMQSAESGLAADYKKRLHCVRIRAEGQQFMLQTDTARQCVQWIEAFQAATNVASDLDIRPMPVQQTLPRRRRRRPARPADPTAAPTSDNANPAFADTPEGNIAAVEAASRRADHERDRMLAEDQAAESRDAHLRLY